MGAKQKTLLILLVIALISVSCGSQEDQSVVFRETSPDGRVDAVITASSMGATTPRVYELYVVAQGHQPNEADPILRGDHFESLSIKWRTNKFLDIVYSQGRIFQFTNFWQSKNLDNYTYVIEIRLNPPAEKFSLSKRDRWME